MTGKSIYSCHNSKSFIVKIAQNTIKKKKKKFILQWTILLFSPKVTPRGKSRQTPAFVFMTERLLQHIVLKNEGTGKVFAF